MPPTRFWGSLLQLSRNTCKYLCRPEVHLAARHLWLRPLLPHGKRSDPGRQVHGGCSPRLGQSGQHLSQVSPDPHLPWTSTIRIRSPAGQSALKNCWSVLSPVLRLQHHSPPSTTRNSQTAIARPSSETGIQSCSTAPRPVRTQTGVCIVLLDGLQSLESPQRHLWPGISMDCDRRGPERAFLSSRKPAVLPRPIFTPACANMGNTTALLQVQLP